MKKKTEGRDNLQDRDGIKTLHRILDRKAKKLMEFIHGKPKKEDADKD